MNCTEFYEKRHLSNSTETGKISSLCTYARTDTFDTPNIYGNWCAFITSTEAGHSQSVGRVINFYNPNDWALAPDIWEFNQITKPDDRDLPDQPYFYVFNGNPEAPAANGSFRKSLFAYPYIPYTTLDLGERTGLQDRYEIMSFAAEARTSALGRTALNPEVMTSVNLQREGLWPEDTTGNQRNGVYGAHKWHSAQFRSTNMQQKGYWETLLGPEGFDIQQPSSQ